MRPQTGLSSSQMNAKPLIADPAAVREQFPILQTRIHGKPLAYLDNGASTQKPLAVIDAIDHFYRTSNANIHRAVHQLSQHATEQYESARLKVQQFLGAADKDEVIFTRGTTESINLVAASFGAIGVGAGDEILLTELEHHSNIVPWQMLAERVGAVVRVIPITDAGELRYDLLPGLISDRTKLVALTHTSNALGTVIDVKQIIDIAHRSGAKVLVDGAQWVGHADTNVRELGCDFYVFSGHKLFAPTGVGVLWGRRELLEAMPPYQGGGDMIRTVSFARTTYADLPNKFEAGTPDIAGVIGLGEAINFLNSLDRSAMAAHEDRLLQRASAGLQSLGATIIGTAACKAPVISFLMNAPHIDHHTLGTLLDGEGVAVRTGHHCCMPLMDRLGIPGTTRASIAFYNSEADIDQLLAGVKKIRDSFARPAAENPQPARPAAVYSAESVPFAAATAGSPDAAAQLLVEDFNLFGDWEQKHEYLLDLGKKVRPVPAAFKIEVNRVQGCQSTVHLVGRKMPGTPDTIEFAAQSDAFIVNGLIALLSAVFSGQRAADVLRFDVDHFFDQLGLTHHLSMGRRNGLAGMVSRVRWLAAGMLDAGALSELGLAVGSEKMSVGKSS